MSKSRIGFDLNAELEDDEAPLKANEWSDGDEEENDAADRRHGGLHQPDALGDDEDDEDDDDGFFTAAAMNNARPVSEMAVSQGRSLLQATANRGGFDMNFLSDVTRDDVVDVNSAQRPTLLNLPLSEFKTGIQVWVGDANDVLTIMKSQWEPGMLAVCNGKAVGTVLRHAGEHIVVSFPRDEATGVLATFTFPRACLLLTPFPAYDAPFSGSSSKLFADGGGLNPKAGHDKKVPEPKFTPLAPLDRQLTVGSPCKVTEKILAAIEDDNFELAFSIVEDRKKRIAQLEDRDEAIADVDPITAHCSALIAMAQGLPAVADAACAAVRARGGCENITLFLRAWHAKMMLGHYSPAHDLLNHAHLLAPHECAIDVAMGMTTAMKDFADRVKAHQVPLVTAMSYRMERRCISTRYFVDGDCIALDEVLFTAPSAVIDEQQAKLCHHCCTLLPEGDNVSVAQCRRKSDARFCSPACEEAAWNEYRKFEIEDFGFSYRSVEFLINQRQNSEHYHKEEEPMLESAHMACRAIAVVGTLVLEAARSPSPDTTEIYRVTRAALAKMGLYPAPETAVFRQVPANVEYQIKALHSVLTGRFPEPLKQLFDFPTFRSIVATVHTYRRSVWMDATSAQKSACFNAVTLLTGAIPIWKPRPSGNARLLKLASGELCLYATTVIDPRSEVIVDQ